ncbi:MAG: AarF/UbiB family protein [Gemmatimonadaceae bacterium]|nr:AarF/UbiB family protein [Gemmatimonadaceae bacterium]
MRALVILLRALPLLLAFRRDFARWLVGGAPLPRSAAYHAARAERLARRLAAMGPTFVKLAQLFAGRRDIIPEPYISALGTLTDRVPPVPTATIVRSLTASYGAPPTVVFEQFDPEPLAAASLGQVHRARVEGRDVVVKVLRPGVERMVRGDIAAARTLLRWFGPRLHGPHVDGLRTVLDEFERRVADEMDFRQEARYAQQVRANFAGTPGVRVPEVLPAWVRQRALVLEYVEGARVDRLDAWIAEGRVSADGVLRTIMELYVRMMLVDGLFHADPHPGNILVDPQGRVVLLDFGMVVEVPVELRRALVRTVFASIKGDAEAVVDGFYALGLVAPGTDRTTMVQLAATLIELSRQRTTATERMERVMQLADEVMATLYDFPVLLPGHLVYFARTAALIEGLGVRYDARFNAIGFASPIVLRLRREILTSLGEPLATTGDWPTAIGGALGALVAVAKRAAGEAARVLAGELGPLLASVGAGRGRAVPARRRDDTVPPVAAD